MGFGENVEDALTFKILTIGKRPRILHRSVVRSALDHKIQNKRVQFDKLLPVIEQRDQYKHPSKVIEVEEADPALRPKPKKRVVKFVDEMDKHSSEPVARRTRAHRQPVTKVLANMTQVNKASLDLTDLFKRFLVAVPAVICFLLNAPVPMNPPKKSLNGLQLSDTIPELGEKETLRMTDAMCNMKKGDFDRLKYIQAVDILNEEEDDSDFDKSLWDVSRILRHKEEHKKVELYV